MTLYCPDCKQHKPEEEFYVERRRKSGRTCYCKACALKRVRRAKGLPEVALTVEEKSQIYKCAKCGQEKRPEDFYRDNQKYNGRASYCKECSKKEASKWEKNNKEKIKVYRANYYCKRRYGFDLIRKVTNNLNSEL